MKQPKMHSSYFLLKNSKRHTKKNCSAHAKKKRINQHKEKRKNTKKKNVIISLIFKNEVRNSKILYLKTPLMLKKMPTKNMHKNKKKNRLK